MPNREPRIFGFLLFRRKPHFLMSSGIGQILQERSKLRWQPLFTAAFPVENINSFGGCFDGFKSAMHGSLLIWNAAGYRASSDIRFR